MSPDHWQLYREMFRSRLFEQAVMQCWQQGQISGEMHLAIGEEAISAGVLAHVRDGDALALDHRGTPQLLMRGLDPVGLLLEFLGHPDGLCAGNGGHMHLFSKDHLAASSGIVAASCPSAVGFALAGTRLRPESIAVAFFGEGALNQGMAMESFNLAAVWKLPVLFVCKDNRWSITTPSASVTAGKLTDRAAAFGIPAETIDGSDVDAVWKAAHGAVDRARHGRGPSYLHMTCSRPEGHFLGDPLLRIARGPVKGMKPLAGPLLKSVTRFRGASLGARSAGLLGISATIGAAMKGRIGSGWDPLKKTRKKLAPFPEDLHQLEKRVETEIASVLQQAAEAAGIDLKGGLK